MSPSPFEHLAQPTSDPIFAIAAEAKAAGPEAINGTVGMLLNEDGTVKVLASTQQAIYALEDQEIDDFGYPPLNGLPAYRAAVHNLLGNHPHMASIATTGGTEAVSMNLRLLDRMLSGKSIIMPTPTWANHAALCKEAGIETTTVPYLENNRPSIEHIAEAVKKEAHGVLLHGTCHNPSGLDLSNEQWTDLAREMSKNGSVALVDLAYQGFARAPADDARPISILAQEGVSTLVAWSASKNHSIYSERTGLAAAITPDEKTRAKIDGTYAGIIRSLHSASAVFGQRIVAIVQQQFQDSWKKDLHSVRFSLVQKRMDLSSELPDEFAPALGGNGMFALLPLSSEEIARLKEQKVFLTGDGRINIGGIPTHRISELAEKIRKVHG